MGVRGTWRARLAAGSTATAVLGGLLVATATPAGAAPGAPYQRPGVTERVSVASDGSEARGGSSEAVSLSADGRYVVFNSTANNLVPGDTNGTQDVFVRDRLSRVTERMSVASDGSQGNGASFIPSESSASLSADGRFVTFHSWATNLVPNDTNGTFDVFVRDRQAGVTERVSVASDGTQGNGMSTGSTISADGRYVAFRSAADKLVPNDTNNQLDIFVHDRQSGITERVSVASGGIQSNGRSERGIVSADGRYVAFQSLADNLVPTDTNVNWDVFVRDRQAGVTERVSVDSDGGESHPPPLSGAGLPAISTDGRYVAFHSLADDLVLGDTNDVLDVFLHDRAAGTTERVSVATDGTQAANSIDPGLGRVLFPAINADGRYVAFMTWADNLVPRDTNFVPPPIGDGADVFVRDRGPAVGIGDPEVRVVANQITVSGWATFSGTTIASAEGSDTGDEVSPEITGASVAYQPEQGALLFRLGLASLPPSATLHTVAVANVSPAGSQRGAQLSTGAPVSEESYRIGFELAGTRYEVRARAEPATNQTGAEEQRFSLMEPRFTLHACAAECVEVARLSGGIGTTGTEVRVSLPLQALGTEEGAELAGIEATAERIGGVIRDTLSLPDALIPISRVELGIGPASMSETDVDFTEGAELAEGRFSGALDASSLAPGAYRVWARACLGKACGADSVEVTR